MPPGADGQWTLFPPPIKLLRLIAGGGPVEPPRGVVYSTDPKSWTGEDGLGHVVKGPEVGVIVAECVGYLLAERVGVAVPPFAVAHMDGTPDRYFASQKLVKGVFRDASPWLRQPAGRQALARIALMDVWVANRDRNHGGLLAHQDGETGGMRIVAIDYEKAVALRGPHPLVMTPEVPPASMWPQGELGPLLQGEPIPTDGVAAIRGVSDKEIEDAVGVVAPVVGASYVWGDSTIQVLKTRRDRIHALAAEVWQA